MYAAADVFVHPAHEEPFGMVLVEAMAARTPVVATQTVGSAAIIIDGKTGLLVPTHDPRQMARAVAMVLTDSSLRKRLVDNAAAAVSDMYSTEAMLASVNAIYEKLSLDASRSHS
jgi:glycosyltransferase involved in cell wall biosynthesis